MIDCTPTLKQREAIRNKFGSIIDALKLTIDGTAGGFFWGKANVLDRTNDNKEHLGQRRSLPSIRGVAGEGSEETEES